MTKLNNKRLYNKEDTLIELSPRLGRGLNGLYWFGTVDSTMDRAFSLPDGEQLSHIQIDRAVINNGLAVAGGRLYAVCEDGTVRCYE